MRLFLSLRDAPWAVIPAHLQAAQSQNASPFTAKTGRPPCLVLPTEYSVATSSWESLTAPACLGLGWGRHMLARACPGSTRMPRSALLPWTWQARSRITVLRLGGKVLCLMPFSTPGQPAGPAASTNLQWLCTPRNVSLSQRGNSLASNSHQDTCHQKTSAL